METKYGDSMFGDALKNIQSSGGMFTDSTPTKTPTVNTALPGQDPNAVAKLNQSNAVASSAPGAFSVGGASAPIKNLEQEYGLQFGGEATKSAQELLKKQSVPKPQMAQNTNALPDNIASSIQEAQRMQQDYIQRSQSQADQLHAQGQQVAQSSFDASERQRELGFDSLYNRSNLSDLGYSPEAWARMTIQQKEEALSQNGFYLSDQEIKRIRAGGDAQIGNLRIQQDYLMNQYDRADTELQQSLQRQTTQQEKANAQNDVTMRALANRFGGAGAGESFISNVAVMKARNEGVSLLRDIEQNYGNQILQSNADRAYAMSTITNNINSIEQGMQDALSERYMEIQEKAQALIAQGVTNVADLNKLLLDAGRQYFTDTQNIMQNGYNMLAKERETALAVYQWQKEYALQLDTNLMASTGYLYQNGERVIDQFGEPVNTFARTQWASEEDRQMSVQTGYMFRNGEMLIDQKTGQPIATFSREQYNADVEFRDRSFDRGVFESDRNFERGVLESDRVFDRGVLESDRDFSFSKQQFNENVRQFGLEFALREESTKIANQLNLSNLDMQRFEYDVARASADVMNNPYLKQYIKPEDIIGMGAYVENGKAKPLIDNITAALKKGLEQAGKNPAFQCVQFVRSILPDLPMLGVADSFKNKMNKLVNAAGGISVAEMPRAGDAVVLDWGQYGHVGMVVGVNPQNRTFEMLDYNASGPQQASRVTISMDDPKLGGYWRSQNVQGTQQPQGVGGYVGTEEETRAIQKSDTMNNLISSGNINEAFRLSATGKDLDQSTKEKLSSALAFTQQLENYERELLERQTGPFTAFLREKNPLRDYDETRNILNQMLESILPQAARGVFGEVGVLTDSDMERYRKTLPTQATQADIANVMTQMLKDTVAIQVTSAIESQLKSGGNVSMWYPEYNHYRTRVEDRLGPRPFMGSISLNPNLSNFNK